MQKAKIMVADIPNYNNNIGQQQQYVMNHINNNGIYKIKSSQNIRLDDDISRQAANSQMQNNLNQTNQNYN